MASALDSNLHILQTAFTSGELDPLVRMRTDLKAYFKGGKKARNVSLYAQGGVRRRPGSIFRADLGADSTLHEFSYTEGQDYALAFQNTKCLIYNDTGTLLQTLTSCPWNEAQSKELTLAYSADTIIVCHQNFAVYRILRTGATTFTAANFVFEIHSSGAPTYQPYYKFLQDSSTMNPSGTSGTITLTCSEDVFVSGHVNTIFRYKGKEITINSIVSATVANATVLETLPASSADTDWGEQTFSAVRGFPRCVTFHDQRLYFAGSTSRPDGLWGSKVSAFFNFDVGTALDDESIDVTVASATTAEIRHLVATRNLQLFSNGGEIYVPQSDTSPITPTNIRFIPQTPYGSSQKVNPVKFDGATLYLQRTGKVIREFVWNDTEQAYTSNAVSILSNHLISDAVDSAVLLGTDTSPEQFAFFVNADGTMAVFHSIRSEGLAGWVQWNTNGNYKSATQVGTKMFTAVQRTINGSTVYWLEQFNDDITLDAVKSLDTTTELQTNGTFDTDSGWTKGTGWTIDGSNSNTADCSGAQSANSDLEQSISTSNGKIYRVRFTLSNVTAGTITPLVASGTGSSENENGTYIQYITASTGANLQFRADSSFAGSIDTVTVVEVSKNYTAAHLLNTAVKVAVNDASQYGGEFTANGSGVITMTEYAPQADVGLDYTVELETMSADGATRSGGAVVGEKKRISRVVASVLSTQSFTLAGNNLVLSQTTTDFSIPPVAVEGDYQFFMLGWALDPTVVVTQNVPLPFSLRGLYLEVTA
jgi:hypothetical protein